MNNETSEYGSSQTNMLDLCIYVYTCLEFSDIDSLKLKQISEQLARNNVTYIF